MMKLSENLDTFIRGSIGGYDEITMLDGDASVREYLRVCSGDKSYILCIDRDLKQRPPEDYLFYIVYTIFKSRGIPVPDIHSLDSGEGLVLLQDVGDDLLEIVCNRLSSDRIKEIYRQLIEIVVKIQTTEGSSTSPPFSFSFDIEKLMYEFNFFIEHALLNYFKAKIREREIEILRHEFQRISEILYVPEYFVLNHRDFHSRNILIYCGKPYLIDFQDARMGLVQYDLVSLLRDSYTVLENSLVENLKMLHFDLLRDSGYKKNSYDEYEYLFDIMAFQRNIKALGTFGYQITSLGRSRYERYIGQTLGYVKGYVERRGELKRAAGILRDYIEVDW
jgi:aminoglycoside/choline kinase family phosphotransferase